MGQAELTHLVHAGNFGGAYRYRIILWKLTHSSDDVSNLIHCTILFDC